MPVSNIEFIQEKDNATTEEDAITIAPNIFCEGYAHPL